MLNEELIKAKINEMLGRNSDKEQYLHQNCWNTTRKIFDGAIPYRWEHEQDMKAWLEANTHPKSSGRNNCGLRKYDIISFWYDDMLMHTVLYLGEGKVFHKEGNYPYEITAFARVLNAPWHRNCDIHYHKVTLDKREK